MREDFFLWRTNPDNELMVFSVVGVFGLGLGLVVVRRLWRSRSRIESGAGFSPYGGVCEQTPLNQLESLARRCMGRRPAGMTYGSWLEALQSETGQLEGLGEAIALHQQWRFDPQPVDESKRERLRELVSHLEAELKRILSQKQKNESD